ncbi:MAG: hypothetical protein J6D29_04560 [Solobacterium sp.]|nr:hypothetical protein [Solobacterium sp.]
MKKLKGRKAIAIIDVPSGCAECIFKRDYGTWCCIIGDTLVNEDFVISEDCPLILAPLELDEEFIVDQRWENTLGAIKIRADIEGEEK